LKEEQINQGKIFSHISTKINNISQSQSNII
jgi:hypothetical protein